MKIALYVGTWEYGGVQRIFVDLANAFHARGHKTAIVGGRTDYPLLEQLNPEIERVALHASRSILQVQPLAKFLKLQNPDILLSGMEVFNLVALAARDMARSRSKVVVSSHTLPSVLKIESNKLVHRWMPALMKLLYRRADRWIAVSNAIADDVAYLTNTPRDAIAVVPNPVDLDRIRRLGAMPAVHPWLQGNNKVVIASGRLVPRAKNFDGLIHAFARVKQERDAKLIILGEGPERDKLAELVADLGLEEHVSLPGAFANPYAEMAAANVFCLSSRWEGFGVVLIEALALGMAIVAVDCPGGPAEILEHGRLGRLVPPDETVDLAESLIAALDGERVPPTEPDALASKYGIDNVAATYLDLFKRLNGGTAVCPT